MAKFVLEFDTTGMDLERRSKLSKEVADALRAALGEEWPKLQAIAHVLGYNDDKHELVIAPEGPHRWQLPSVSAGYVLSLDEDGS